MKLKMQVLVAIVLLILSVDPCWPADVKYPTKPIHMWVSFAPGGSTDVCARSISSIAEKVLGQPIVVENKPGGGGALVMGLLATAPPDGYTLTTHTDTPLTRSPHLIKIKYDPIKDFIPLVRLGLQRQGIVVRTDSPFKTIQDLIEYARKNPGQLSYGTPGPGTTAHIGVEKLALAEKVKFQHIPFQGDTPTMTAILGGHVMAASTGALAWTSHVRAGSLRLILIFDPEGMEEWPEIPTLRKLGYKFEVPTAQMVSAPKGVPKPIIDKLTTVFSDAVLSPQFQKVARDQELMAAKPLTGTDLQKWLQSQYDMYGTFTKEVGLKKAE